MVPSPSCFQHVNNAQHQRRADHYHQRRQDEAHQRQSQKHWETRRALFVASQTLGAHFRGEDSQ